MDGAAPVRIGWSRWNLPLTTASVVMAVAVLIVAAGLAVLASRTPHGASEGADEDASPSAPAPVATTVPSTGTTGALGPGPAADLVATGVVPPIVRVGRPVAMVVGDGVVVPVLGGEAGGWTVRTPCSEVATIDGGTPLHGAHVVIDPGHGGVETGAVGPGGSREKDLNLAVARHAVEVLRRRGLVAVLTRDGDHRVTLSTRAELARSLRALAFVSIHFNAEPDGPSVGPGTETYYQVADEGSRRLAGLVWEESASTLAPFEVSWVADTDAGAKYRRNARGEDYYGILRRSSGVVAVLAELGFVSNPPEERLFLRADIQRQLGEAVARAVVRYLSTDDGGSGFVEPYPRTAPAGPGGGSTGCVDPPLGRT